MQALGDTKCVLLQRLIHVTQTLVTTEEHVKMPTALLDANVIRDIMDRIAMVTDLCILFSTFVPWSFDSFRN